MLLSWDPSAMKSYTLFEYDVKKFEFANEKELGETDKKLMKYSFNQLSV